MAAGQAAGPALQVDAGRALAPTLGGSEVATLKGHSGTLAQASDLLPVPNGNRLGVLPRGLAKGRADVQR
jgi:hypothetical protein